MKTLKEIIAEDFKGFKKKKLEFWDSESMPDNDWDYSDWDQFVRFSQGENFEEIMLRNWLCTDTIVGFNAILWNGKLFAFTYQRCRKCDRNWAFLTDDGEALMHEAFQKYRDTTKSSSCEVVLVDDPIFDMKFDPSVSYDWMTGPYAFAI